MWLFYCANRWDKIITSIVTFSRRRPKSIFKLCWMYVCILWYGFSVSIQTGVFSFQTLTLMRTDKGSGFASLYSMTFLTNLKQWLISRSPHNSTWTLQFWEAATHLENNRLGALHGLIAVRLALINSCINKQKVNKTVFTFNNQIDLK